MLEVGAAGVAEGSLALCVTLLLFLAKAQLLLCVGWERGQVEAPSPSLTEMLAGWGRWLQLRNWKS